MIQLLLSFAILFKINSINKHFGSLLAILTLSTFITDSVSSTFLDFSLIAYLIFIILSIRKLKYQNYISKTSLVLADKLFIFYIFLYSLAVFYVGVNENEGHIIYVDSFKLSEFLRFVLVCVSPYFIVRLIVPNKNQIELFMKIYSWFLFLISLCYIFEFYVLSAGAKRIDVFLGLNTVALSSMILPAIFYNFYLGYTQKKYYFIFSLITLIGMLITMSRGSILAFFSSVFFYFLIKILISKNNLYRMLLFSFITSGVALIIIFNEAIIELDFFSRFLFIQNLDLYFENIPEEISKTDSVLARIYLYYKTFNLISYFPIFGAGTVSYVYSDFGVGSYPHNMFLEIASEVGLFGLSFFLLFLFFSFYYPIKVLKKFIVSRNEEQLLVLLMVVYFAFIMTRQVSFALIASRDLFLMAGLVLVYAIQLNKKYGKLKK
jgi:O-antigen ligase